MDKYVNNMNIEKIKKSMKESDNISDATKELSYKLKIVGLQSTLDSNEDNINVNKLNVNESLDNKYTEQDDVEKTTQQIEDAKDEYLYQEEMNEDEYMIDEPKEGIEVIDQGYDYGAMPQGTEDY